MRFFFEISLIIILFTSMGCTTVITILQQPKNTYPQTASEIKNTSSQIDKAYYSFLGTFFNGGKIDMSSSSFLKGEVLRSVPIWNEKEKNHWFTMAWYSLATPEVPLAIGVFHLEKHAVDTFKLNYYDIPRAVTVSEIWTSEHFLSEYEPQDLLLYEGCSDLLIYEGNNSFKVINDSIPCYAPIASHLKYFDLSLSLNPEKQVYVNRIYSEDNEIFISYPKVYYDRVIKLGN